MPVTRLPSNDVPSRRNAEPFWSMTATSCPWLSRLRARVEPTRPQPMITKCTAPTLHARVAARARRSHGGALELRTCQLLPARIKRVLLGRAMRSDRLGETLLPKRLALPVFASDALSSVAYAPDEIFLTLRSPAARSPPRTPGRSASASSFVMLVVVASYRQNVHAYPSGGGDYEVATVNLGPKAGPDGGQRPAGRLRPHRRGVGVLGRAERRRGADLRPRPRDAGRRGAWSCC